MLPLAVALPSFAGYTVISLLRYATFKASEDLAIFAQGAQSYSQLRVPTSTIKASVPFNLLGDHFSPILALTGPLYRFWPDPRVLLLTQAFLFAAAVTILVSTARDRLGSINAVLVGVAFALSWGITAAVGFDFHEIAFAMPLLALSLKAYLDGMWIRAASWASVLCLVKEDLCLTAATIGLLIACKHRRAGIALAVAGLVSFGLITAVVIPAQSYWGRFTYWSASGSGVSIGALSNRIIVVLGSTERWTTFVLILVPCLFLCVRSRLLFLLVPGLAVRFLSEQPSAWGHEFHYSATAMVIAFFALVDFLQQGHRSQQTQRLVSVAVAAVGVILTPVSPLMPTSPLGMVLNGRLLHCQAHCLSARAAIADIPLGSSVMADQYLTPHLVGRTTTFLLLASLSDTVNRPLRPQYAIVDTKRHWPDGTLGSDSVLALERLRYDVLAIHGDFVVLARTWQATD